MLEGQPGFGRVRAAVLLCFFRTEQAFLSVRESVGAWLSLARAPGSGPGGRWFKSTRPDHYPKQEEAAQPDERDCLNPTS